MNAGAYGREWSDVVVDARRRSTPTDARTLALEELGLSYRHSALVAGQVVAQVRFRLVESTPEEVKATVAELLAQRKATQPTNKRTFGSVFKNPDGRRRRRAADRGVRAEGPPDRRCAHLAAARELHRERGRRDVGGLHRADGRGAATRARAVRRSSSSTRCSSSARSRCRRCRELARCGEVGRVAARRRTSARTAVLPVRRGVLELARFAPSGRSLIVGVVLLALVCRRLRRGTRHVALRGPDARGARRDAAAARARCGLRWRPSWGGACSGSTRGTLDERLSSLPRRSSLHLRPRVPAHASRRRAAGAAGARAPTGQAARSWSRRAAGCCGRSLTRTCRASRASG